MQQQNILVSLDTIPASAYGESRICVGDSSLHRFDLIYFLSCTEGHQLPSIDNGKLFWQALDFRFSVV